MATLMAKDSSGVLNSIRNALLFNNTSFLGHMWELTSFFSSFFIISLELWVLKPFQKYLKKKHKENTSNVWTPNDLLQANSSFLQGCLNWVPAHRCESSSDEDLNI